MCSYSERFANANFIEDRLEIAQEIIPYDKVIRLRDGNGEHKLSILICPDGDGFDISDPDGKVLLCAVDPNVVEILALHLLEQF